MAAPTYRFGKHPPKQDYRTVRLGDYITPALPPPPPSYDVLTQVYDKLDLSDPDVLFPMDGNDTYGDCTIAAMAHGITTYCGLVGIRNIMSSRDVVRLYLQLTGGIDSGLDELTVLNYWQSHPASGDKILAFAKIDARNHVHVQQAIRLFGGVYLGFQVQNDCVQQFQAREPWTPGVLTQDGHAVYAVAYDPTQVTVLTWGNTQQGTWAWWDECVDEAYAILPPQAEQSGFASGFNFVQLKSDLAAVAS